MIRNFTMDVDPGYKNVENVRGGLQWYMMQSKDFVSSIFFNLKNENSELAPFNEKSNILHYQSRKFSF